MRPSSLLLRGKTPPPRRLTLSVPATMLPKAAAPIVAASFTSTAGAAAVCEGCGASETSATQPQGKTSATVEVLNARSSAFVSLNLQRGIAAPLHAALRSFGKSHYTAADGRSRAFSAPLRVSQRCAGQSIHVSDSAFHNAQLQAEEEEVISSFADDAQPEPPRTRTGSQRGSKAVINDRHGQSTRLQSKSSANLLAHGRRPPNSSSNNSGARNVRGAGGDASSTDANTSTQESRAALSARIMRRHRQHASQPYLALSSGVEVPGCGGGAYQLQERQYTRTHAAGLRSSGSAAAAAAGGGSSYAARVRSGGNNVRMSVFPATLLSPSANASSPPQQQQQATPHVLLRDAAYTRMQQYEPFDRLLRRYLERGHVANVTQRLLHHPEAPAPVVLLDRILQHRVPAPALVSQALLAAMHAARADRSSAAEAAFALERVTLRLRSDAACRTLYDTPDIRALLLEAALRESLYDVAVALVEETPAEWVTPSAWTLLVQAAGQSKLPHSRVLWQLLSLREGAAETAEADGAEGETRGGAAPLQRVLTRAGESALLKRVPLCPAYRPGSPFTSLPATAAAAADPNAPPAPPSPSSTASAAVTATTEGTPQPRPAAPSSETPLELLPIPSSIFDTRPSNTVWMPRQQSISNPLLRSDPISSTPEGDGENAEARTQGSSGRSGGGGGGGGVDSHHEVPALPPPSTASAIEPSTFSTEGVRWCALNPGDLGYAAEHYNGDAASSAGDFRAVGAAGVLHGFASFQSLFAEVEKEAQQQRQRTGADTSSSTSSSSSREARRVLWETTALRMLHQHQGVVYGLDATTTARVLLRCGVSFSAQASPMIALHVLRRYVRSCHLLREELVSAQTRMEAQLDAEEAMMRDDDADEKTTAASPTTTAKIATTDALTNVSSKRSDKDLAGLYPRLSRAVAPHPSPFLVFFKVMREARDVLSNAVDEDAAAGVSAGHADHRGRTGLRANTSLPMVHWELVWHSFQLLNRENPQWYTQLTLQEAGDLCQDVIEVLCHGADPWLALNLSRWVSVRHIMDGVDMSLWLLHRLDPSHHTEEAREVARKLFRWLLVDVGLHLQPSLHHHLIPAARALIRLGLQEELRVLYSAVLDNVYLFRPEHRDAFIEVLRDLICPSCATILPESDVYVDRACPNCMTIVPAKDAETIPSFRLSAEHVERLRARRKQQRQRTRQRLSASVHRLQTGEQVTGTPALRGPQDAADVLRRHLQKTKAEEEEEGENGEGFLSATATLVPGVSVSADYALFPLAGGAGNAQVLDVRAAMEESSRRLELQRAARRYTLAQRGELDDAHGGGSSSGRSTSLTSHTPAAMPTVLPISAQALDAATLKYLSTAANASAASAAAGGAAVGAMQDGVWVCVWCQEKNSEWSSRVQCSACGAETGPAAPWRHFAYADPVHGDVMTELRGRMSNCEERPVDAIVAGYLLMVYRRTFQLRATPADQERLLRLIAMLCRLQERVLAAYVYTRLVPITQRSLGGVLDLLAQTFGQDGASSYRALTPDDLVRPEREGVFFEAVFGPQTCRVCFGAHDWHVCPIVTRDFAGADKTPGGGGHGSSPISLSPEEKQRAVLERLSQLIHLAANSVSTTPSTTTATTTASSASSAAASAKARPNAQLVVNAYTAFVSSPFREVFAEMHADDTNQLSLLLSRLQQYRRAAFVLCHIPPAKRATAAYLRIVHFFNVTEEEALALLGKPTDATAGSAAAGATAAAIPNFVQVTKTCCMCLDQRHASHECPRLAEWLRGVQRLALSIAASASTASPSSTGVGAGRASTSVNALVDSAGEARLRQRLRAQVDGWTTAGPERLHAFYRYLVAHMDLLRPAGSADTAPLSSAASSFSPDSAGMGQRKMDFNDPLIYAVNKTITKLATVERRSDAYRLYAHAPIECVSAATTAAVLRMNGFAEDSIRALLRASDETSAAAESSDADVDLMTARSSSSASTLMGGRQHAPLAARTAAVPVQRCCLLCFSTAHAYVDCPELAAVADEAAKLLRVVREVGGISCVPDGIGAAAAYVYGEYNRGRLSSEMMRGNPELVRALLTLARRCFATHQLSHGVRVLRRVPVEMVPPASAYADLWRAAGLSEDVVEEKQSQLLALLDAEGLVPCIDPAPPRPTYSNTFLAQLNRTLHDELCRHCFEHGHTIATCPLFHAEVSFGRDYVAAYRMSMMSEQLDRAWQEAYLLKLVDFFSTHYLFMPYHIAGVANALNAITAMWSFRGEPGIALRNLLLIPPAYRRRQAFKHVLHSLRVPPAEITRLLGDFYFAPDAVGHTNNAGGASPQQAQQQQEVVMAQHLLIPKPAIRDLARRHILEQVPAAMAALEESAERMAHIRESHERRSSANGGGAASSSAGISAHIRQSLRHQQQEQQKTAAAAEEATTTGGAASFQSPILRRVMQSGDMVQLREDFDPILAELEDAVGMRLGSRHTLFTSAMDILGSAAAAATASSTQTAPSTNATVHGAVSAASGGRRRETDRAAPSQPSSPSQTAAAAAAVAPATAAVREAEVVIEVQTQSVTRPSQQSPQQQQQQQQQQSAQRQQYKKPMHNKSGGKQWQNTPAAKTRSARKNDGEDEIESSFHEPTSRPAASNASRPQQQQQTRRVDNTSGQSNNNRNRYGARNNGSGNSRAGYSNSSRDGNSARPQNTSSSRHRGPNHQGNSTASSTSRSGTARWN